MRNKQIQLTPQQRERALIELIEDAKDLKFSSLLIKRFNLQLLEIQREIKKDKEKSIRINKNLLLRATESNEKELNDTLVSREIEVLR